MIIIGLGNPGEKYENTRHNIGFMVIDKIKEMYNLPDFKLNKNFNSLISQGLIKQDKIILAKPQTFMNDSGKSVRKITDFHKTREILIIHDDIDILYGKIKIAINRGSAGHKGIESIFKETGIRNFIRIRVGICPKIGKPKNPEKFVLQKFSKEEKIILDKAIENAAETINIAIKEGVEKAMNEYNR